jgi:hypothetical protein
MVTFEKLELTLFWKKVDQLGTQIFYLELNKSLKTLQFNNQLLAGKQTLLAFNEGPQALGGTTYYTILLGFILFMNRKIIDLFADGNIRIVLFCLDSTLASRLAYNYNILLFNPTHYFFILVYKNRNGSNFALFNLLSLVCTYLYDEQGSFINCRL